jgi:hypothetical protein
MPDHKRTADLWPIWRPGAIGRVVLDSAAQIARYKIAAPPLTFYKALAARAEEIANEAIAETLEAGDDDQATIGANLRIARRLLREIGDDIFLATEQAGDPILARLAAYLVVEGNDGYNDISYVAAWEAHRDPEWGTVWSIHQYIRDLTPAFLLKVCMRGDARFLAVECRAPARRLPDEPHARLRARTLIMSGVPVLAFSPTEIEADAGACAVELSNALAILGQELLALNSEEPPPRRDFRPRSAG